MPLVGIAAGIGKGQLRGETRWSGRQLEGVRIGKLPGVALCRGQMRRRWTLVDLATAHVERAERKDAAVCGKRVSGGIIYKWDDASGDGVLSGMRGVLLPCSVDERRPGQIQLARIKAEVAHLPGLVVLHKGDGCTQTKTCNGLSVAIGKRELVASEQADRRGKMPMNLRDLQHQRTVKRLTMCIEGM
jgi:hypothetical protein